MAKKRRAGKDKRVASGAAMAAVGAAAGNVLGQVLADAVASYLSGGKKKRARKLSKSIRHTMSQLVS